MKKHLFLLLIIVTPIGVALGQDAIDSMVKLYPSQKGVEKAKTLSELCFYTSYSDLDASLNYGKLAYETAILAGDSNIISRTLSDWSVPHLRLGKYDSVIILNQLVLDIEIPEGDSVQVAASLNKMGLAEASRGNNQKALAHYTRALAIFKEENIQVYVGQILACMGNIYDSNKMYELALDYYEQAEKIASETDDITGYITAVNNQGHVLQELKRYREADLKLKEANGILLQQNNNPRALGLSYQTLGLNALYENKAEEGLKYYRKAIKIFSDLDDPEGLSSINLNMGYWFLDKGDSDSATFHMNAALQSAKATNSYTQLQSAYKGLVSLESLNGNYAKADEYFKLYELYSDSIYNSETNQAIADMQVKYETEQKTQALKQEKLKRKNAQLWLVVAAVSVALLLFFSLFIRHRKKLSEERLKLESLQSLENERVRIARDLHDNLGADLTVITSKIDIQAFKQNDPNYKKELETISKISKSANSQLRDTIWSIHKSSLNLGELSSKISDYARRVFDEKNTAIVVNCSDKQYSIQPSKALHLFRISQEFLNNSLKYANATKIEIDISSSTLVAQDNGLGFDEKTVVRGYGLNNIAERVVELGGRHSWEQLNPGTRLTITY
jgi:signal transduction histidine kinase